MHPKWFVDSCLGHCCNSFLLLVLPADASSNTRHSIIAHKYAWNLLQAGITNRQPDEVQQLVQAFQTVLKELAKLPPPAAAVPAEQGQQHQQQQPAAAAGAAVEGVPAVKDKHGFTAAYVGSLREALVEAGVRKKLPPACGKVC